MWAVWFGLVFLLLKVFEVGPFATLSWWWIALPFGLAFFYFEVLERMLSLDKKKAHKDNAEYKKKRLAEQLKVDNKRRKR